MAFLETVTERIAGHIIASTVRPATEAEIAEAERLHSEGQCPHNIVRDERGWLYDFRFCVTCGSGLGII